MSVSYKILLMCAEQEDQADIHKQLMDYFRIHEPGAKEYVVFEPIAAQGFFCDYVKDLEQSKFVDYVKNMSWRNDDYVFLAVSSNSDPFEVCIARRGTRDFD